MTRSLQLDESGDLAVSGRSMKLVSGFDKLKQDLDCWLKERYGQDRFHPAFGSILDYYIGQVIDSDTVFQIRSEVVRVLDNYQQLQLRRVQENQALYSYSQLLDEVIDVRAVALYDRVNVTVVFRTADQRIDKLTTEVSP